MEVLAAAVEVVETMLAVVELLVKVMMVENQNHNLHLLMIEVAVEVVQEPQVLMEQMTLEPQVMEAMVLPQQLQEPQLIMLVEAEEALNLLAEHPVEPVVLVAEVPVGMEPQELQELLILAVEVELLAQHLSQVEQVDLV